MSTLLSNFFKSSNISLKKPSSKDQGISQDVFGDVVHSYTRQQAISDGTLIDVTSEASETGFKYPVAITLEAYQMYVGWTEFDNDQQTYQDTRGRLHDILTMLYFAITSSKASENTILFKFYSIPRDGVSTSPDETELKAIVHPGDDGEPVITIMLKKES